MQQSDEVQGFLASVIQTFGTPQMASAFSDAMSTEPGTLFLGTDPEEWWDDPAVRSRVWKAQGEELQGAVATVTHSEGWVEGDVGWGAAKVKIAFGGELVGMMRFTATLARRPGGWKIVQGHVSVGVPNEVVVGKELTV